MKWRYETDEMYRHRIQKWHPWFAWHPVWGKDGNAYWLMWIERQAVFLIWNSVWWDYRELPQQAKRSIKLPNETGET